MTKIPARPSSIYDSEKCFHYYIYFIDDVFGLCYLRVPTRCPFRLQFYLNGHNWLAHHLDKTGIRYKMEENAFLANVSFERAQALSDNIRIEKLHTALDIFVERYCPVIKKHALSYRWSIMQVQYATDIVFKKQADLEGLYESLVRTAIHSVKPENIAFFLGQKLHFYYLVEMGNRFNTRILETRIKHQIGAISLKMYDKFGLILRIETTTNDVSQFKHFREVQQRDGHPEEKNVAMKKNTYSLFPLMNLLKASIRHYLEFISTFDDPILGIKRLQKILKSVASDDRSCKGINFYNEDDQMLLEILALEEFNSNGLQNRPLHQYLPWKSSSAISRILKRLKIHGLLKKVPHTYKYYLTRLGEAVVVAGLMIREMFSSLNWQDQEHLADKFFCHFCMNFTFIYKEPKFGHLD